MCIRCLTVAIYFCSPKQHKIAQSSPPPPPPQLEIVVLWSSPPPPPPPAEWGGGDEAMNLQEAIKDPLLQAKFKFVEFISQKLNLFIRGFQTDQPMVPFLSGTLLVSLMNILY